MLVAAVFSAALTAVLVAGWLAECLIRALISADALRARFRVALWDEMRVQLPLGVAVAATAILIAFAADMMGLVALGVFIGPLLVTQMAFRRYAGIRATYLETVRALARVTEVGGYVEDGHARRVGRLAVVVGRELGMSEPELLELPDPEPDDPHPARRSAPTTTAPAPAPAPRKGLRISLFFYLDDR